MTSMTEPRSDPWQVLGVDRTDGVDAAKVAWRELVSLYHPDHHQGASPAVVARASQMLRQVNGAWYTIRDGKVEERRETEPAHTTSTAPTTAPRAAPTCTGVITGRGL